MRIERLIHDARYARRVWSATPGLSVVAVLTIAPGIGASTAIVPGARMDCAPGAFSCRLSARSAECADS